MATSKRDVTLGLSVETTGEDSLKRLAADVRKLAQDGSDAAPQYKALADQLDRLSQQATSLKTFQTLSADLQQLTVEQGRASTGLQSLRDQLDAQVAATDNLRAAQVGAREEMISARETMQSNKDALRLLVAETSAAGKTEQSYIAQRALLTTKIAESAVAFRTSKDALADATREVNAAVQVQTNLTTKVDASARAVDNLSRALAGQQEDFNTAKAAAEQLGVATTSVTESQQGLAAAQATVVAQIRELQSYLAGLAELERANAAAANEQADAQRNAAEAYRVEEAALAESVRLLEADEAAKKQAADAARLHAATIESETQQVYEAAAAARGMAEARDAARAAAASELAILADSEKFSREYAATQERAAKAARDQEAAEKALAVAQEQRSAASKEQAQADALAAAETRGMAEAMQQAKLAAQSELAAIAESDKFVKEYTASMERARLKTIEFAAGGRVLNEAFGVTGVRSLASIEAEIRKVELAMGLLIRQEERGVISTADLSRALSSAQVRLQALKAEMANIPMPVGEFEKLSSTISGAINKFAGLGAAIATIGIAVKPVIDAEIALQSMTRVLTTVTGSAAEAAKQIEFLRNVSQQSGQSFSSLGESYSKFAAAALQVGVSTKDTQQVFTAVALAAGNMGLSSDQAKRALEALSQMASKGVVSMEELRQQLGDALPGVLPALAKELGLTTAELSKVVETGGLLSNEAIPAIGRAIKSLGPVSGEVTGLVAEWNRFKNVMLEAGTVLVEGPLGKFGGAVLGGLAKALEDVAMYAVMGSSKVQALGETVAAVAAYTTGHIKSFSALKEEIGRISDAATKQVADFQEHRKASDGMGAGAGAAAGKLGELGTAAEKATNSADGHAKSMAALSLANKKAVDATEQVASAAEKHVAAVKKEAEGVEKIAGLYGNATAAADAHVRATSAVEQASNDLALADEKVVESLRKGRQATIDEAEARGQSAENVKIAVAAFDKLIFSKTADAEKSNAQAEATKAARIEAELAADKAKDTSGEYDKLAAAAYGLAVKLQGVREQYARGKSDAAELRAAEIELAIAMGKVSNAIDDQKKNLDQLVGSMKVEAEYTKAQLQLEIAKLKNLEQEALRRGDVATAQRLAIQIADTELKITQSGTKAKLAEADAIIAGLKARKEQLILSGQTDPVLHREIDLAIRKAETEKIQAQTTAENTKEQERHMEAVKNGSESLSTHTKSLDTNTSSRQSNTSATTESTKATNSNSGAVGGNAQQYNAASAAVQQYIDRLNALRQGYGLGSGGLGLGGGNTANPAGGGSGIGSGGISGFGAGSGISGAGSKPNGSSSSSGVRPWATDAEGKTLTAGGETWISIANTLEGYGLSKERAQQVASEFVDANGNVNSTANRGQLKYGGPGSTMSQAIAKAAQFYIKNGMADVPTPTFGVNGGALTSSPSGFVTQDKVASSTDGSSPTDTSSLNAFDVLGIGNPTALNNTADSMKAAFISVLNGNYSEGTKQEAFLAYAKAAVAANGGVMNDEIASYGAAVGLSAATVDREVKKNTIGNSKLILSPIDTAAPADIAPADTPPDPGPTKSPSGVGSRHTVTITINGKTQSIDTASEVDSATLTAMLQQIADDANRTIVPGSGL